MTGLRAALPWLVVPGLLTASLLATSVLLRAGAPEGAAVLGVSSAAFAILLGLQRVMPHREDWRGWAVDLPVDLRHAAFSSVLMSLFHGAPFAFLVVIAERVGTALGGTLWPSALPMPVQLVLALVVSEVGHYAVHFWMHHSRLGWRLHAVHHSAERLYVLTSARSHPFNMVLMLVAGVTPLLLLGAHGEVVALFSVFHAVNGFLQHANVDVRVGPLSWILATPDLHRLHHSVDAREGRSNLGGNLMVFDVLFGTRYRPDHDPDLIGVPEIAMPRDYWGQLRAPFRGGHVGS